MKITDFDFGAGPGVGVIGYEEPNTEEPPNTENRDTCMGAALPWDPFLYGIPFGVKTPPGPATTFGAVNVKYAPKGKRGKGRRLQGMPPKDTLRKLRPVRYGNPFRYASVAYEPAYELAYEPGGCEIRSNKLHKLNQP